MLFVAENQHVSIKGLCIDPSLTGSFFLHLQNFFYTSKTISMKLSTSQSQNYF